MVNAKSSKHNYILACLLIFIITIIIVAVIYFLFFDKNKIKTGGRCMFSIDCINGACGRNSTDKRQHPVCCPSGKIAKNVKYTSTRKSTFCADLPNGSNCWSESMCAGGACSNADPDNEVPGTCYGKGVAATICDEHSHCNNNACGLSGVGGNKVCCISGGTVPVNSRNGELYCTGLHNGEPCIIAEQCASGNCRYDDPDTNAEVNGVTTDVVQLGTCTGVIPDGEPCSTNNNCLSNACGRPDALPTTTSSVCCSSGLSVSVEGSNISYCTGLKEDTACVTDLMCFGYCQFDDPVTGNPVAQPVCKNIIPD